jgi:hypothetical protein
MNTSLIPNSLKLCDIQLPWPSHATPRANILYRRKTDECVPTADVQHVKGNTAGPACPRVSSTKTRELIIAHVRNQVIILWQLRQLTTSPSNTD